jgi:hypothetical protein
MINFFRRIRKQLADDNKPLKYMRYAIGEIVLVVIGILIALSINNWNESKKTQEYVDAQLNGLIEAIELDAKNYDNLLSHEGFRFHALKYLLELLDEEILWYEYDYNKFPHNQWTFVWDKPIPNEYDEDFLIASLRELDNAPRGTIINSSAMNEFNSTGLFSSLKNVQLKEKINNYYRHTDKFYNGRGWDNNFDLSIQFRDLLLYEHQVDIRRVKNVKGVIESFKNDKIIISNLQVLIDNISWSCQTSINSRQMAQQLIDDIKAELNQ